MQTQAKLFIFFIKTINNVNYINVNAIPDFYLTATGLNTINQKDEIKQFKVTAFKIATSQQSLTVVTKFFTAKLCWMFTMTTNTWTINFNSFATSSKTIFVMFCNRQFRQTKSTAAALRRCLAIPTIYKLWPSKLMQT